MGLDMYAYRLKAEFAPAEEIHVSSGMAAAKAMGFEVKSNDEVSLMDEATREVYLRNARSAIQQAVAQGVYDTEFGYWRKFNHLHGFMAELYRHKGGTTDFNTVELRLTKEDLQSLQAQASGLPATSGFFFGGTDSMTPENVETVIAFTKKALQAIEDGYAIYYDSWW
jgi:hypothetical protein